MPIQGLRTTDNFVANQRPQNWRETILMLYPNGKAPLTALTGAMKSSSVDDPTFNWWDKAFPNQRMAISATIDASQTSISVTSGARNARAGHVIRVEQTSELLFVRANPSTDTALTVQRGFAGSTATAMTIGEAGVNPNMHIVGTAFEQGSMPPAGINYDPTQRSNNTQIFRNTLEFTRTAMKTKLRTGDQVKEAKRECLELHSVEMEKAYWFGKKSQGTFNGKPLYTTDGVFSVIDPGNIVDNAGTDITMRILEGWLERIFRFGSSEKMAYCGNSALLAINQVVRKNSQFNIQSGIKEYGMNVQRLTCPFGELVLKTHPLFNQLTGGSTGGTQYYGWDTWMAILDMDNIKYRYFSGDDTRYEPKLEANGMDGMMSGYISDCGLEIAHPLTHFLIKGVSRGIADAS